MRTVGFSTGALARGDFRRGIDMQLSRAGARSAIELSALRDHELEPLVAAIPDLQLDRFEYVSFHAPSRLGRLSEDDVISAVRRLPENWPVVVHPEIIATPTKWRGLGARLCVENMDNRKTSGRTVGEMRDWFAVLPEARFCLDVGHARQIDPTMTVALLMLTEFSERLAQIHWSEVGPAGEHLPVHALAALAFGRVAHRIPESCPIIIESVIDADRMSREIETVRRVFDSAATFAA